MVVPGSGESFVGFMGMMAPTVAIILFWLFAATWWLVPKTPVTLRASAAPAAVQPRLLMLAGALFVLFVVALDRHWLLAGLGVVFGAFLLFHPRVLRGVDWALLAIIALGWVNRQRVLPALGRIVDGGHRPGGAGILARRTMRGELALMLGVFTATAALISYTPPVDAQAGPFSANATIGPAQLQLTVEPAEAGPNTAHLYLIDGRTGAPFRFLI